MAGPSSGNRNINGGNGNRNINGGSGSPFRIIISKFFKGAKDSLQFPVALFVIYGSSTLKTFLFKNWKFSFFIFLLRICLLVLYNAFSLLIKDSHLVASFKHQTQKPNYIPPGYWSEILRYGDTPLHVSDAICILVMYFTCLESLETMSRKSFSIFNSSSGQRDYSNPSSWQRKTSISSLVKTLYKRIFMSSYIVMIVIFSITPGLLNWMCKSVLDLKQYQQISILLTLVEYIAVILKLISVIFLMPLIVFDLKGLNRGWELSQVLIYLELNTIYFSGFGISFCLVLYLVPFPFKFALYSLLLPMYVIIATRSQPKTNNSTKRIPLFYINETLTGFLIRFVSPPS